MLSLAVTVAAGMVAMAAAEGCKSDPDCPWGTRCCGTELKAENCPPVQGGSGGPCTLPGSIGATTCSCVASPSSLCGTTTPAPATPGQKQWLMIGDSISYGCLKPATALAAAKGIQVTHNPTNAANVWWGSLCLGHWLRPAEARNWDVISFNFGLHDLALDNERVDPPMYGAMLANITADIATAFPTAKLLWVSTTPVPSDIGGFCNKSTGQGGCPPRRQADPPIYNAAAAAAIEASGHADRVTTLDLYSVVTARCGTNYTKCPEGCEATKAKGGWDGNCFQIPGNVHFLPAAWTVLATAYVNAVAALLG